MALFLRRLASAASAADDGKDGGHAALCGGDAAHRRLAGGGGGQSIFELGYGYVDGVHFWLAFVGMIAFCVLVDRTQALLDHCAEGSPTNERFLQKVYTELLMFGVVAVTLFMMMQVTKDISPKAMTTITFIDVLCSMGACGLISIAGVLSGLRTVYWKHWVASEHLDKKKKTFMVASESKILACEHVIEHAWAHMFCATTPAQYSAMSRLFKLAHKTPEGFKYHMYLAELLTRECCELMSINWASWVMLLSAGCLAVLVEIAYTAEPSFNSYLIGLTCLNWSLLIGHLVLLVTVRRAFSKMTSTLPLGNDCDVAPELDFGAVGPKWGERTGWALQVLQLFNSFCLAFYLMHGMYNLRCVSAVYDFVVIAPLLVNILVLLPLTLPMLVLVDGFFLLDPSALDNVLGEHQQADEDFRYMFARWQDHGCPDFNTGNNNITLSAFRGVVPLLGMNASPKRVKRIFDILDTDNSGVVDVGDLLKKLKSLQGDGERLAKVNPHDLRELKQASSAGEKQEKQARVPKEVKDDTRCEMIQLGDRAAPPNEQSPEGKAAPSVEMQYEVGYI